MTAPLPFQPRGVIPACLLPFDRDLAIDEPAFRAHLNDVGAVDGITAITINAHATEVATCSIEEQERVMAITMEEVGDRLPVVHGVYADGSHQAARIARRAQRDGAGALLVFPSNTLGMGGQLRPEMALAHLKAIADASDLPIIIFQYPLAGGLGYPVDTLLRMCDAVPTVVAIKDWCNDAKQHEQQLRELHALSRRVNVLSTHSSWLLSSLVLGCDGLLSGAGSVIAALQVALFNAVQAGDLAEARRIADRIYPTTRAFYDPPFLDMHNRMKHALVHLGRLREAHVRPPLMKLPDAEIRRIGHAMDAAGLTGETVYSKVA
ncbi:MAG: dihydrodipicolinate synthase family protein [Alphaproteobacteria bacterium]|nr:dihydrodipicolinate synthase family protein [Alphaproteobacteria bacterium]